MGFGAFEALSVGSTAVGFTSSTYGAAKRALFYVEGGSARCRLDGTAPTATVGMQLDQGQYWELEDADEISRIKFISTDSGTVTINANFGG